MLEQVRRQLKALGKQFTLDSDQDARQLSEPAASRLHRSQAGFSLCKSSADLRLSRKAPSSAMRSSRFGL